MSGAEYVTEISVPSFGDNGVQRLRSHMRLPEPLPEPGPDAEWERGPDAFGSALAEERERYARLQQAAAAGRELSASRALDLIEAAVEAEPELEAGR